MVGPTVSVSSTANTKPNKPPSSARRHERRAAIHSDKKGQEGREDEAEKSPDRNFI